MIVTTLLDISLGAGHRPVRLKAELFQWLGADSNARFLPLPRALDSSGAFSSFAPRISEGSHPQFHFTAVDMCHQE